MEFKEFLNESRYVTNGKLKPKKVYHTSSSKGIKSLNRPIWFALDIEHANAWQESISSDAGEAYIYAATVDGKIADVDDKEIKQLFNNENIDLDDYIVDVVSNPTKDELLKMPGTKLLLKKGYVGIVYLDYDPSDFQNDLDALLVLDPSAIKSWKKI